MKRIACLLALWLVSAASDSFAQHHGDAATFNTKKEDPSSEHKH